MIQSTPAYYPFATGHEVSADYDAPLDSAEVKASTRVVDVWSNGLDPQPQPAAREPASGAVAVLIALLAIVAFQAPQLKRILSGLDTELLGVRRRANAFDSHTLSESRTLGLLILLGCVCQAILLGAAIDSGAASNGHLLLALTGLTVGYYIFQYVAYAVVGYTFTDKINAAQWRHGFNLSQGLLGLCLVLPALGALYYREATTLMVIFGVIFYFMSRIAFLCKGFRIFYNGLSSLVYFILYLCAMEIIPVILVIVIACGIDALM